MDDQIPKSVVAVIGGGPAGLMAAEILARGGAQVHVYDAMPSLGRKFLMAGKGGLNLTHSEDPCIFLSRYGDKQAELAPMLAPFGAGALREWALGLGVETFVGTSGRVFPRNMKAAPLLRAWLHRLRGDGVRIYARHRWLGWDASGALSFATPQEELSIHADAVVLALGGASWPRLGSDGAWTSILAGHGVAIAPLRPANCGFDIGWSPHFSERHAGQAVKSIALSFTDTLGTRHHQPGEFMITATGVEGSLIYANAAWLRDRIEATGSAALAVDLLPHRSHEQVLAALHAPRGARSLPSHLQSRLGLKGVKFGLLREVLAPADCADAPRLAATLKALPLTLRAPRPVEESISTAGGVRFDALDEHLMLRAMPGVFCAGEMLDWEAPTGGYLLTACFATGRAAGLGVLHWLRARHTESPSAPAAPTPNG